MDERTDPENELKEGDPCPLCGQPLVLRHSGRGDFLGCSDYPACTFMQPLGRSRAVETVLPMSDLCPRCGAPLALCYKAVNTMDSMVGYRNDKYLHFGRGAAKLDDGANYIPSRISALLWILGAFLNGNDGRNAWKIWRRDGRKHASPNSAQTESACAGALNIQLAGPAYYFGEYYDKPTIGDPVRPAHPADIVRANRLLYLSAVLGGLLLLELRGLVLLLVF